MPFNFPTDINSVNNPHLEINDAKLLIRMKGYVLFHSPNRIKILYINNVKTINECQ